MAKRKSPRPKKRPDPLDPDDPGWGDPEQPLTPQYARYVDEYLVDLDATRAYRCAFPGCSLHSAHNRGYLLLRRANVRAAVRAGTDMMRRRSRVRADDVIGALAAVLNFDYLCLFDETGERLRNPRHVPMDMRRCVTSIRVVRETTRTQPANGRTPRRTVTERIIEYKWADRMDAVEKLCNHLGLKMSVPGLDVLLGMLSPEVRAAVLSRAAPGANGAYNEP